MTRLAAIDVGTNSVRLYLAEAREERVRDLARELVITRLGEGVDRAGTLGAGPVARTVHEVAAYARKARDAGAALIRICATSAVRDAANGEEFVRAVRETTGISPEVLSGEEEARLGFLGATAELAAGAPFCVVDIGGGSTEFVRGEREVDAWISVDIGSVRLTERHIRHDPPASPEITALEEDIAPVLDEVEARVAPARARTLVGLAGTITTVAAIALGLDGYDRAAIHHAVIARDDVEAIARRLAAMSVAWRRTLPAMPPGREDVIVAGATLLRATMHRFGFDRLLVSESDILDGILRSMLG